MNTYEILEAAKQRIKQLSSKKAVVFTISGCSGFFSVFFFLCQTYIYAQEQGYPLFIKHDTWQYLYEKGWHDYFTNLSVFIDGSTNATIEDYKHLRVNGIPHYSIAQYMHACRELFKPNDCIRWIAEKYSKILGDGPYLSLYVRRGDKTSGEKKEMEELSIETILAATTIRENTLPIFVQTDDYRVVEELEAALPGRRIFTLTPRLLHGTTIDGIHMLSPAQKKNHTMEFLVSVLVFLGGSKCWTDSRSNVGRFHKLMEFTKVSFYDTTDHISLDKIVQPYYSL